MKPFNLEAAKAGKPVCTRGGKPARIICFDLNDDAFTIVALLQNDVGRGAYEAAETFTSDGRFYSELEEGDSEFDLFMAPVTKTVWINLYSAGALSPFPSDTTYESEEKAKRAVCETWPYLGTFPITYEE